MQHAAPVVSMTSIPPKVRASQHVSIDQVRAFVVAATHRSISDAARQLGVSQPTLSRCIKDMELALDAVLFERTPRGIFLSEEGERLLSKARRLLGAHTEALAAVDHLRHSGSTRLNLIGSFGMMPILLPTLLGKLKQMQRPTSIQVLEATTSRVIEAVVCGEAPLGVCVERPESPELRCTTALEVPLGLLTADQGSALRPVRCMDDLEGLPLVRYGDQARVTRLLVQHGVEFRAYFASPVVVNTVEAAAELVRSSGLVAVVSGIAASHPQMQGLRFTPLPELLPSTEVAIVSRRRGHFDDQAERMRELVRDSLWEAPWHPSVKRPGGRGRVPMAPCEAALAA